MALLFPLADGTPFRFPRPTTLAPWVAIAVLTAAASAGFQEGFEGPRQSWRIVRADCGVRTEEHRRTSTDPHGGRQCEHLRIRAGLGTYVHASHDVPPGRVIAEISPQLWLKCDRPGLQLMARVVFPRTTDRHSGEPATTLIRGSLYTRVGQWQRLSIEDVPALVARAVRLLRTQLGPDVDPREAYIDRLLLNVYGGAGVTNVWIDDLTIDGLVTVDHLVIQRDQQAASRPAVRTVSTGSESESKRKRFAEAENPPDKFVRLQGSVLLVNGRPFFPRAVVYRGEPLAHLAQLGFNSVWMRGLPTPTQLEDAGRSGLRLICPPPPVEAGVGIGPMYGPVLAWDLGQSVAERELASLQQRATAVRCADEDARRPLVCSPEAKLWSYSRQVDILFHRRHPLGTSFPLADFGNWLRQRPRLARPGTPFWASIQTEPSPALVRQLTALSQGHRPEVAVEAEQIRALTFAAIAAGARGICFESHTRLDGDAPPARRRANILQRLNLELSLVEPWAASGTVLSTIPSSDPTVNLAVLATERARLLLPVATAINGQHASQVSDGQSTTFVVPGAPDSGYAYQLSPAGLRPLRHKRVTGGVRLTVEELSDLSLMVLTQDPLVVNGLTQRLATRRDAAARLQREIAAQALAEVERVRGELAGWSPLPGQTGLWVQQAHANLRQGDQMLAAGDPAGAGRFTQQSMQALARVRRAHWEHVLEMFPSATSSPCCVFFATLPWHWKLADRLRSAKLGPNRLMGGECEDLQQMEASGWQHLAHTAEGIGSSVSLSPESARNGRYGLRLRAVAVDDDSQQALVESPVVWINSAPVPVRQGQIVRIQGWIAIRQPIVGNLDGMMIVDSLGGLPLAERFRRTKGWQEFVLYRAAERDGVLTVTFALAGTGDVSLDDVTIRPIEEKP